MVAKLCSFYWLQFLGDTWPKKKAANHIFCLFRYFYIHINYRIGHSSNSEKGSYFFKKVRIRIRMCTWMHDLCLLSSVLHAADQLRKERILLTLAEPPLRARCHVHQSKYKSCIIHKLSHFSRWQSVRSRGQCNWRPIASDSL